MRYNLLAALLVSTFLTSNAFATGTIYEGEESNDYVINLGGTDAEDMVSYDDKIKVVNTSGKDSVTIKYATFENLYDDNPAASGAFPEYGPERGGAISSLAPINEITGSVFKNNTAKPVSGFSYGGALHVQQTTVGLITDTVFDGNQAISEAQSRAWGGAIHSNRSDFEGIVNSTFTNNIAQTNSTTNSKGSANGGAIEFNGGRLEKIENSTFTGNKAIATGGATAWGGAIYLYSAGLGDILNTTFKDNYSETCTDGEHSYAQGGALSLGEDVWNYKSDIVKLYADFTNNHAKATYNALGGAIYIVSDNYYPDIQGSFTGNYANGDNYGGGGAIRIGNATTVKNMQATFNENYVKAKNQAAGGAIDNRGTINKILSDFLNNYAESENDTWGGAIYNDGNIVSMASNFNNNYAKGNNYVYGGIISNYGDITSITGSFTQNHAYSKSYAYGGAIDNGGTIANITGNFIQNYADGKQDALGGAISNYEGTINNITGDFTENYVLSDNNGGGGAIDNEGAMSNVMGNFTNNYAISSNGSAFGGAIYNNNIIRNITGSFTGNRSISESDSYLAYGGAIQAQADMTFSSGDKVRFMSGNYTKDNVRGKNYNAIFVGSYAADSEPKININTNEGGAWVINDNIEGGYDTNTSVEYDYQYDLSFEGTDTIDESGSTKQYINMNNAIINAKEISVRGTTLRLGKYNHEDKTANNWEGQGKIIAMLNSDGTENLNADAVTSLSLDNGVFDISNGYYETIKLKNHNSNGGFVHLDVDVDNLKSDILSFNGDVKGTTNLVLYASSDKDITGEYILFAQSENDNEGSIDSFKVARVYKSPYLYDVVIDRKDDGINTTHNWELTMKNEVNPNKDIKPEADPNPNITPEDLIVPDKVVVTPEVIGSISLPNASVSQSSGMVYNIMRKVGINKVYCPGCGFYDYNWDGKSIHNVWADTTYNGVEIKSPVEVEAKVWGIEAGADLQQDLNNKLGVFLSYRKGNYEMNGKGEKYVSTIDSELDIDSYTAGLYYRYDNDNLYAFSTVYGGFQDAEITTGDGFASDTDGIEFGASAEIGYSKALSKSTYVTPSVGVFYSQIDYDDITDSLGNTTKYDSLKQVEVEAGVKVSKAVYTAEGFYSVYAKPSVVQTLTDGDEINITKLGKVDTLDNQTLGRMEVGGKYGFEDNWSVYGWANYTFGSDYKATSLGLGVNYAW